MYTHGGSYKEANGYVEPYGDIKVQQMEKELLDFLNIKKLTYLTTVCSECTHVQRGNRVFCSHCLKKGKLIRRLTGCRSESCYANTKKYPDHMLEKEKEEKEKENIDITKDICKHQYLTGKYKYVVTPVMHIVNIINSDMDDRIRNSTEEEFLDYFEKCNKNDSISAMMCHNLIYCFEAMGKYNLVEALIKIFSKMENIEKSTDCFRAFVDGICDANSVESRFYLNSMHFIYNVILRSKWKYNCS